MCADLARAGYVAVSCNYVLSTKEKPGVWPQNIADCREAVRWMRQNARDLGIDPQRIAVAGGSAGGYLALMVGLTDEKPELGGNPNAPVSSKVSAVIDMEKAKIDMFYKGLDIFVKRKGKFCKGFDIA